MMGRRYLYSEQTGPTLPGGGPLYFRTVTTYLIDSSNKATNPVTYVYYTAIPGGRAKNGDVWTPGDPTTNNGFNQGGYVLAAITTNKGASFNLSPNFYTQEDADAGRIPSTKNIGDPILDEQAIRSLNTRNGIINQGIQNSIISSASIASSNGTGSPQLAFELAAKLQNSATQSTQQDQQGGNQNPNSQESQSSGTEPTPPNGGPDFTSILNKDFTVGISTSENYKDTPRKYVISTPNGSDYDPKGIRYPLNQSVDQDLIKFQAVKIIPGTLSGKFTDKTSDLFDFQVNKPTYEVVDGPIFLPIQAPISDQNGVEWGPDSLNSIDAFVFGASLSLIKEQDTGEIIKGLIDKIYKTAKTEEPRILKSLAGAAAGINNVLARTDNVVLNQNLELLFNAPQLRPFTFTFKLSAREEREAKIIKQIIKYFKYHMAPRTEANKLFLKAPDVFTIRYMNGNNSHKGINLISNSDKTKACALTNCSVDYTPLGSYMTYNDSDKTMVSYTINLQFQEITPVYDSDYHDVWDHPIGY